MLIDGLNVAEGSDVSNLTVDGGDATAQAGLIPTVGELFFRTDLDELQVYLSSGWAAFTTGAYLELTGGTMTGNLKTLTTSETVATPTISAGALTLDLATANIFEVSLDANVTSMTISNPPASGTSYGFVVKLNITGSFTVTWPASVKWPGGTAPTLTTTNGQVDTFVFYTLDNGASYYGFTAGQDS